MGDIKQVGFEPSIIHATLDHALKVSSKSACKPLTIEFVARLLLVSIYIYEKLRVLVAPTKLLLYLIYKLHSEPCYEGEFKPGSDPAVKEKLDAWLLHLPQVLWEIGNSNLLTTEVST
jgi:pre-rRNA-processing protein IPI1